MANAVNLLIIVHYGIPFKLLIFLMIVQMVGQLLSKLNCIQSHYGSGLFLHMDNYLPFQSGTVLKIAIMLR